MNGRRGLRIATAALAAAALTACARGGPAGRRPDIVLVSIDTLRADHLGCYGSAVPTSPRIDGLARRATRFATVVAPAASTLASHASLFTARAPQHHGARFGRREALPPEAVTLAETLAAAGYRTEAVTAGGQLAARFGVAQGFDHYQVTEEPRGRPGAFARKVAQGLEALDRADPRPLFLFLHTYEVHLPYTPDPALLERLDPGPGGGLGASIGRELVSEVNSGRRLPSLEQLRRIERAYDAEILSVDAGFGALVDGLAKRGRLDRTVVVLTSDHGEEFGEHGAWATHSHTLYEELLRVPLVVWAPGGEGAGRVVTTPVRLIDVAPTLVDFAGVAPPAAFDGRSLRGALRGEALEELPGLLGLDTDAGGLRPGVRFARLKLHDDRLYDLEADPRELTDLSARRPDWRARAEELLRRELARHPAAQGVPVTPDEREERLLKSLGYLR